MRFNEMPDWRENKRQDPNVGDFNAGGFGKIFLSKKQYGMAVQLYQRAVQKLAGRSLGRSEAHLYAGLALALAAESRWKEAEEAMGMAVAAAGKSYIYRDDYKSALKEIRARKQPQLIDYLY